MGPRVHEALYGEEFPAGVQLAENLMAHGIIDAVLPADQLAQVTARALRVLCGEVGEVGEGGDGAARVPAAEEALRAEDAPPPRSPSGAPAAPNAPAYGPCCAPPPPTSPRSAAPARASTTGLLLALARVGGTPCVVLGHDRADHPRGMGRPSDPPGCAPRGAVCGSPPSWTCRCSRSSTPPGRAQPRGRGGRPRRGDRPLPRRHGDPARADAVPAARPGRGRRRARPAARGPGRRRPARVALPLPRKARRRSCTGRRTGRTRSPTGRAYAPPTCAPTASSTAWWRRTHRTGTGRGGTVGRTGRARETAGGAAPTIAFRSGSARCSAPNSPRCAPATRASGSPTGAPATGRSGFRIRRVAAPTIDRVRHT
ncbi:hypothetical protein NKH77_12320 [Streptomyces sp. M19]